MKKLPEKRTLLLVCIGIGLAVIILTELCGHMLYVQPPKAYSPQKIAEASPFPIDINTASEEESAVIPQITEAQVRSIIACREENGGFSRVEDVLNVKGIGKASYERLSPYIAVNAV